MKIFSMFMAALLPAIVMAAPKRVYKTVEVHWTVDGSLEDSLVLQCDDEFYSGIDLKLPGDFMAPEMYVSYQQCGVDWSLQSINKVTGQEPASILRFRGHSPCLLNVREKVRPPKKPRTFKVDISDAC
ncbi:MAG: hypothetical protein AB7N80_09865 [Bdellovibrionales bacterium]